MPQKGIWVQHSPEYGICYETSLREETERLVGFVPFEHPYEPRYLGSIKFVDIIKLGQPLFNLNTGLVQTHFYPLGGDPSLRPELVGKGLARKIELIVAKELLNSFQEGNKVFIPASSESHLAYCKRVGIPPSQVITLNEYLSILSKVTVRR